MSQFFDEEHISYSANFEKGSPTKIYKPFKISNVLLGNYSYIAYNSCISNTIIGKFCSIGPNFFCGWGIHPLNGISTSPVFYSTLKQNGFTFSDTDKVQERKNIYIGNDVFIGANVIILDGVEIGDGAVIGAGSVVSKNIPPYAIAFGNPIQIIKYRFEKDISNRLLKTQWWDWNEKDLNQVELNFFDVSMFDMKY